MKKILIFLLTILTSLSYCYSQNFLGKPKAYVKNEILKSTTDIGTSPEYGYDKYWWGDRKINCYAYFNYQGICFLECTIVGHGWGKSAMEDYSKKKEYHCYIRQNFSSNGKHEYVQNKITAEVLIKNSALFGEEYYFWFYKSENKNEVEKFFSEYYRN